MSRWRLALAGLVLLTCLGNGYAALLAEEPFDYPNTTNGIGGLNGGSGFSEPWSRDTSTGDTNFQIRLGSLGPWGILRVSGGKLERVQTGGKETGLRGISATLPSDELWFSLLWDMNSNDGFAIASDSLDAGSANASSMLNSGSGFGMRNDNDTFGATVWKNGSSSLGTTLSTLSTLPEDLYLFVGHIEYNSVAGDDLLSIYSVGTDLQLPDEPISTVEGDLDETLLDSITLHSNRGSKMDEIRIGESFDDVVPAEEQIAENFYVATNGNDSAAGTLADPFATMEHALNQMGDGDTCFVRGGRYHEQIDISSLSGRSNAPMVLKSYNNEPVVIDGSIPLNSVWTTTNLNGHQIYTTTAPQDTWQLFVDGRMQVAARWPNFTVGHPCDPIELKDDDLTPVDGSWWDIGTWGDMASSWNSNGVLINDPNYHDLAAKNLSFSNGTIVLNYHSESQFSRNIISHKAGDNELTYDPLINPYDKSSGKFLIEALNALDTPGEWYYDQGSGKIFFWPLDGKDPNNLNIRAKTFSYGLSMTGCSFITIDNIDFFASAINSQGGTHITIQNCRFSYPTWFRRMLGEHTHNLVNGESRPEPMGEGGIFLTGPDDGSYYTVRNCIFEYSDGLVDMSNGYGNLVENNLFHHWSFTGMASYVLAMNSSPESLQIRNTFRVNGSKVMSKHSQVDVEYSRASHFGYLQHDGCAWQCAGGTGWGGPSDGLRRHHNWHHQAFKTGARWDGYDGYNGWNDHMVSWNTPGSLMVKGDYHQTHNNTVVFSQNPTENDLRILDDNGETPSEERNAHSHTHNNLATSISGMRHGYIALNGYASHNWNGYLHALLQGDSPEAQLRDPANLDFRPKPFSDLVDAGIPIAISNVVDISYPAGSEVHSNITAGYIGSAPDIGAYEYGAQNYWIPGFQTPAARTPIPPNGTTTAKTDCDLMWLPGRETLTNQVYFGTNSGDLQLQSNQTNNIFDPGPLDNGTYYWRIDTLTSTGLVSGTEWSFSVPEPFLTTYKTYTPIGDTYADNTSPVNSHGDETQIKLATYPDESYLRYGYMMFNIDVTGTVASATLELHNDPGGNSGGVQLFGMSSTNWSEGSLTYNNRPEIDGQLLDQNTVNAEQWAPFKIDPSLIKPGLISFGLKRETDSSRRSVHSRESDYPPKLTIQYETPGYDLWCTQFGISGPEADKQADPEGDGVKNISEYAFGGDPKKADVKDQRPRIRRVQVNPFQGLEYIYRRRRNADAHKLSYQPEMTKNILTQNWSSSNIVEIGSGLIDADFEWVTNRISSEDMERAYIHTKVQEDN